MRTLLVLLYELSRQCDGASSLLRLAQSAYANTFRQSLDHGIDRPFFADALADTLIPACIPCLALPGTDLQS